MGGDKPAPSEPDEAEYNFDGDVDIPHLGFFEIMDSVKYHRTDQPRTNSLESLDKRLTKLKMKSSGSSVPHTRLDLPPHEGQAVICVGNFQHLCNGLLDWWLPQPGATLVHLQGLHVDPLALC